MRWIYIIIVIGIGLVFYLSWVPDPHLKRVFFIPDWVSRWADTKANENIRTGVPFVFLGVLIGLLSIRKSVTWVYWVVSWLLLVGVALLAEVGQLFLPHRFFSWWDIGWGAIGALIGLVSAAIIVSLRKKWFNSTPFGL